MAYSVPKQWSHGDIPTAADFNRYSDGCNDIVGRIGSVTVAFCVPEANRLLVATEEVLGDTFACVHRARYLHYRGTGNLTNLDSSKSSALSAPDGGGVGVYDLDSVSWLAYGQLYFVTGVDFCVEDAEG